MNKSVKIFLDDQADDHEYPLRKTPDGYVAIKEPSEFRAFITMCVEQRIRLDAISFDNDLGVEGRENEGNGLLNWVLNTYPEVFLGDIKLHVHSRNIVESTKMKELCLRLMNDKEYVRNYVEAKGKQSVFNDIPGEIKLDDATHNQKPSWQPKIK